MKKSGLTLALSVLAGALLVGGTFAAAKYAVVDNAAEFGVSITPGTLDIGETKSVTLEWGNKGLIDIEGLKQGQEYGPYKVGLKATTSDSTAFVGSLKVSLETTAPVQQTHRLVDHLHVNVYNNNTKSTTGDNRLILTVPTGGNYTITEDIEVTSGKVYDTYFYISLDMELTTEVFNAIKNDVVTLKVDWNKGSSVQVVEKITYYYHNTNANWSDVYAYFFKEGTDSVAAAWPGLQMKAEKNGIYSVSVDATVGYDTVVFNKGVGGEGNQTANITLPDVADDTPYYDGGTWKDAPTFQEEEIEYYLVGTFTGAVEADQWVMLNDNKFAASTGTISRGEAGDFHYTFKLENVNIPAGAALKVESSQGAWYGEYSSDPSAPNMNIGEANHYDFYFNPTLDGGIHIFCRAHA